MHYYKQQKKNEEIGRYALRDWGKDAIGDGVGKIKNGFLVTS